MMKSDMKSYLKIWAIYIGAALIGISILVTILNFMDTTKLKNILTWISAALSVGATILTFLSAKKVSKEVVQAAVVAKNKNILDKVAQNLIEDVTLTRSFFLSRIIKLSFQIDLDNPANPKLSIKARRYKRLNAQKRRLDEKNKLKVKEKTKTETVTELFLAKQKINILNAKFICAVGLVTLAAFTAYFKLSSLVLLVPVIFFLILELRIRVLSYRVYSGYFGKNRHEALQLLQFINSHKSKDDLDGPSGKRKVFLDGTEGKKDVILNGSEGVV